MSLIGAQLYCVNAAGTALTYTTKGNKFTVGSYLGCDLVLPDAERIHCEIQGDPFGRVTIYNHSRNKPILVNDQVVHAAAKRPLTHGARIEILQEVYIWKFPKTDDQLTPDRQPPQQTSNSSPSFKGHRQRRQLDNRLTVHNFLRYSINSDDEGNTSIEARELDTSTGSNAAEAEESLPKVDLLEATQNKENTSTLTNKTMLKLCARSDVIITSWSPRVTGVQMEKSFGFIAEPSTGCSLLSVTTTPKSVYNTPKSVLSELNDDSCSRDLMEFSTPSTSKKAVAAKRASSMHFIDLTTPQRLRPAAKQTPASSAVISVDSTDESSDASPLVIDITNTSTPSTSMAKQPSRLLPKTPNKQLLAAGSTPKRTPQSLMKRALLTSAKKQLPVNNTTRTTPLATPGRQSLLEARRVCQTAPRRLPFHPRPQSRTPARRQLSALPAKAPLTSPRKRQSITFSNPRHTKSSQMRKTLAAAAKTNPGLSKSNKLVANACRALNSSPKHSSPKRFGSPNAASPQINQCNDTSTTALEHNSSAELSRTFTLNEDGDKVVHSPTVAALEEIAFSITDEYNGTSSLLDQSALKNLNESVQTMQIMSSTPNTSLTSAENAETSKIIDKNASSNDNSGTTPLNHTFDAHTSIEKTEDVLSTSAKSDVSLAKDPSVSQAVVENVSSNNKSTTDEALQAEAQFVIEDSICEEVVTTPTNQEDTVSITHVRLDEDTICEEVPTVDHTTNDAANLQTNQNEAEEEDNEVHDIVVAPPGQTPIPRRSSRRLSMEQQTISLTPRRSLRRPSMELSKQPTRRASCSATVEHHANGSMIATPKRKRRLTEEMSTPTRKSLRRIANTPKRAAAVDESVGDMGVVVEETTAQSAESAKKLSVDEDYGNELPSSAADEPENIDYQGMRELLKTPKSCSTPRLRGLRELMRTPKMAASPCLENIEELLEGNSNDTSTTTTPKRQITVNRINLDISQTEPAGDAQDLYFKTPRGKNLMIPNEPASAVLQTRDNSLATTTEYDLNATNAPLHLDKIFDDVLTVETTNTAVDDSEAEINVTAVSTANVTAADPLASSVASNMDHNDSISSEAMITVGHIDNSHNDPLTSTAFKPSARADHLNEEYADRAKSLDISGMSGIQLLDQTTDSMFSEHLVVTGVDSCDVTLEETNAIDNHSPKKDLRKDSSDTDSLVGLTEPLVVSDDDEQVDESIKASVQIKNISLEQNATNVSSKVHDCKSIIYPLDDSQATLAESEKATTNPTDKSLVKSPEESTFELNPRLIAENATKDDASSENSALDRLEKEVDETSPPDEILAASFEKVLEMSSELSTKATTSFKILKYDEVIGAKGSTTLSNKSTELIEAKGNSQQNYSLNASSASQLEIPDSIEAICNTSSLIKEVDPVKENNTQSAEESDVVPVSEQDDGTLFNESADTSGLMEANKVEQTLDKVQTPSIVLTTVDILATETQVQTWSEVSKSAEVEQKDEPTTDTNGTAACDVQEVQSALATSLNKSSTQIEPSVLNASASETNILEAQEEKAQLKDESVKDEDVSKVTVNEVAPMNTIDINKSVDILPRSSEESTADDINDCDSSVVELDASAINESNKAEEHCNEVVLTSAIKSFVGDKTPDKKDINESVIDLDASNALETEDEANVTQDENEAAEIVSAEDLSTVPKEPNVTPVKNGAYESLPKSNEDSLTVGEDPNIAQMEASVVTEANNTFNDIEQAADNKLSKGENNAVQSVQLSTTETSIVDASPADQSYSMKHEDAVSDSIKHTEKTVLQVEEASETCNATEGKPTPVQSQQSADLVEPDLDSLLVDQPNIKKQDEICEIIIASADETMPKIDDSANTDIIDLDASLSTELESGPKPTPKEDRLEASVADQSNIKEENEFSVDQTAPPNETMPHNNDVIELEPSCNTELNSGPNPMPEEDVVEPALESSVADQSCIKEQDDVSNANTAPADETMSHIDENVSVLDASCNTELESRPRSTPEKSQKSEEDELKQDEVSNAKPARAEETLPQDESTRNDVIDLDASCSTESESGPKPTEDRVEHVADQSNIKEQNEVSDAITAQAEETLQQDESISNDVIDLDASCSTELDGGSKPTPAEDRVELVLESSVADQSNIKEQNEVSVAITAPAEEKLPPIDESTKNTSVIDLDESINTELASGPNPSPVQYQKLEDCRELKQDKVVNAKPAPAEETLPQDESTSNDVIDLDASCSIELDIGPKPMPAEDVVELALESSVADQSNIKEQNEVFDAITAPADETVPQNNDVIELDASCSAELESEPTEDRVELVLESSNANQSNIKEQNEVSDAITEPDEEKLPPIDESTKNAHAIVLDKSVNTESESGPNPSPVQSQKSEDCEELMQDEVSKAKPAPAEETLPQDESTHNDVIDLDASCNADLESGPKPSPAEDRAELVLESSVADQLNIKEHDDVSDAKTAPADETMPHNNDVIDLDASCNADLDNGPKPMPTEERVELALESSVADKSNVEEQDEISDAKLAPADDTMAHNDDVIDLDASCSNELDSEPKPTPAEDRVELVLESSIADMSNVGEQDEISDPIIATGDKTLPKADESRNIEEVIERDASCNTDNKVKPLPVEVEHQNQEPENTMSASSEAKAKVDTSDLRGDDGKSSQEIRTQEDNLDTSSKNLLESEDQKSSFMETDEQVKDTLVSISYDQLIASEKIETTQAEIKNQPKELAQEASLAKAQEKINEDNISTQKSNEATLEEAQSNESNIAVIKSDDSKTDPANTKSSLQVANVVPNEVIANDVDQALPTTESQVDFEPEIRADEKLVKTVNPETEQKITAEILEIPKMREEPKKTSRRGRKPSKLIEAEAATAAQDIAGAVEHKRAGRKSTDAIAEINEREAHVNLVYDDVMLDEKAPKAAQELPIESHDEQLTKVSEESIEVEKPKSKNTKTIPIETTNLEKPKRRGRRLTADIQPTADVEDTQTSEQPKTKQRGGKSTPDVDETKAQTKVTNPIVDQVIDLDVEETTSQDKKTEETSSVQQKPKRRGRKSTADESTAHVKQTAEEPIIQESIDLNQPIIEQTETQVDKKTEEPTNLEKPKRRGRKAKEDETKTLEEKTAEETGVIEKPKRRGRKATADVVETETSADKVDATADKITDVDTETHVNTNPEEAISLEIPKRRGRKPTETEALEEKNLQMPDEANVVQPKRGARGRKPSAEVVEAETQQTSQTKRRGRKASAEVVEAPEPKLPPAETKESQSTNEQLEIIVEAAEPEHKKPRLEAANNADVEPKITRRGRKLSVASAIQPETVEPLQASGSRAKSVPRRGRKATNDADAVIVQAIEVTEQPAQKPSDDIHPIELDSKEKSSRAKSVPRRGRKATNDADAVIVQAIEVTEQHAQKPSDDIHPIELDSKEKSSRAKSVPRRGRTATNDADAVIVQAIEVTEQHAQKPSDDIHPIELDSKEKSSRAKSVPRRGRKATNDADAVIVQAIEETEQKPTDDTLPNEPPEEPLVEPPAEKKPARRGRKASAYVEPTLDEQTPVKKIAARRGRNASSVELVDQEPATQVVEAHGSRAKSAPRRGRKATNDADANAAIIQAVEATEVKAKDDDTHSIELDSKEKSIPPEETPVEKKPARRGRKALDEQPQVKKITARRGRKASPSAASAEPVDQDPSAQVVEPDTIVSVPVSPKPQQLPSSEDELTPRRREGRNLPRKNYDETIYEDKVSAPARRGRKPAATKQATVTTAAKAIETETQTLPKPTTPEITVEPTVEPVVPQTPIMQNTLPEPTSSQRREGRNVPRKNYSETSDDDKPGTSRGRRMRQPTIKALEQLAVTEVRSSTPKRRKGKADVVEEPLEKKPALEHSTPQPVPQSRTAARRKVADVAEVAEVVPVEVVPAPTAAKRGPRSRKASTTVQPEEIETDADLPKQPAKRNARKAKAVEEQTDDAQPTTKKARGGARAKTPIVVAEPAEAVDVDVVEEPTTKRAPAARGRPAKAAVKVPETAEDVQQETTATPIPRGGRGRKVHFEATEEANQTDQPAVADAPKRATRSRRK